MVGALLADRFQVVRTLGSGGMGLVYEAIDTRTGGRVALKTLQQLSPRGIARFKNEFRALADVVHDNLVGLYELFADDSELFFTMELVGGVDFMSWVRPLPPGSEPTMPSTETGHATAETRTMVGSSKARSQRSSERSHSGELDIRRLRAAMQKLAEGVAVIHQAGMLHRDLKPSNVLVTEDGRVVILDFGLVTSLSEEHYSGDDRARVGTPTFMSPEQGARQALASASDWYSVGVMLYLALTGRPPFVGGNDDVLMDKQQFEPPPPGEVAAGVPDDLGALCVELLRRDPARRPTGTEVLRRLGSKMVQQLTGNSTGTTSHTSDRLLVGREGHLAALRHAESDAAAGRAVVMSVHGPSGMGKSALISRFASAMREDAVVLRGRCYEQESVPFKAIDGVIDELGSYLATLERLDAEALMPRDVPSLARVFPVLRQVEAVASSRGRSAEAPDPQELRRRAFLALRELLARLTDRTPVCIAIDDAQWGDIDSAAVLATVLRRPDPPPVLVLISYRTDERAASPFLGAFERWLEDEGLDLRSLEVGPLASDEARRLAGVQLGRHAGADVAQRIADESAGSPFFVEELSRYVVSRGELPSADNVSLDGALHTRLQRLSDDASTLLSTIALAARPLPVETAMRAAQVSDPSALALLKAGSFARTKLLHGARHVECFHDRIRAAVAGQLSPEARQQRHRRLAVVLATSPNADPEVLAAHYRGAGEPVVAAKFAAEAAARASQTLAFERAADLYRLALELDPHTSQRVDLLVARGDALANAGRGPAASTAYLEASKLVSGAQHLDLLRAGSEQLLRSGHIDEGLEALSQVLASQNMSLPRTPNRALLSMVGSRVRIATRGMRFRERDESEISAARLRRLDVLFSVSYGLAMVDAIRAAAMQSRYLLEALRLGETRRIAYGLAGEVAFVSLVGDKARRRTNKLLDLLTELGGRSDDPALRGIVEASKAIVAFHQGRWIECYDQCTLAEQILRDQCSGTNWELSTVHVFTFFALAFLGRTREMRERLPTLITEANDRGDLYAATTLRASVGFYNYLVADDPDGGLADIDDAMAAWSPRGFHLQHAHELMAKTNLDLYAGNYQQAVDRCRERWKPLVRSHLLRAHVVRAHAHVFTARAHLALASQTGATSSLRAAARLARSLEREGPQYCLGLGRLLHAGIAAIRGDVDTAARQLAETEQIFDSCDMILNVMAARRQRGRLLGGDEGAALVASADDYFTREGYQRIGRIASVVAPGFGED